MNMALRTIMIIIASLMLGAHFMKASNLLLTLVYIIAPFILLIKKRWSLIALQALMYIGGGVWISTIIGIAQRRILSGEPWSRMAYILGAIALFTIVAGLLLNSPKVKEKYPSQH
jgi:asparagine N-glycosylation enzyme membrane subunit Stt3